MSAVTDIDSFRLNQLNPIGEPLDAEVADLDTSCPLTASKFAQVRQTFIECLILCFRDLCFRDQHLSEKLQITCSKQFGELQVFPEKAKVEPHDVASVAAKAEHVKPGEQGVIFQHHDGRGHADSCCRYIPSRASVVYRSARYRRVLWRTNVGDAGRVLDPHSQQMLEAVG
jgi:alpha-ketoglutarate-dependent taurine dioxygenase